MKLFAHDTESLADDHLEPLIDSIFPDQRLRQVVPEDRLSLDNGGRRQGSIRYHVSPTHSTRATSSLFLCQAGSCLARCQETA